jgi:chromosome segregation ATPase
MEILTSNPLAAVIVAGLAGLFLGWAMAQFKRRKLERQFKELETEAYVPLRTSYESLQRDHVYLDEENERLKSALDEAQAEQEKAAGKLEGLKGQSDAVINDWKSKVDRMNEDLESKESALKNEKEKWIEEQKVFSETLSQKEKELQEKIEELQQSQVRNRDLEQALEKQKEEAENMLEQWEKKFTELNRAYSQYKDHTEGNKEGLQEKYEALTQQFENYKREREGQMSDWERKFNMLNAEFTEYKRNAEENRQDWAARYNGLQQEFQNYKFNREGGMISDWEQKFLEVNAQFGDYKKKAEGERVGLVQKYNAVLRQLNTLKQGSTDLNPSSDWEQKFNSLNAEYTALKENKEPQGNGYTNGFNGINRTSEWEFKYRQLSNEFEEFKQEMERKLSEKPREIEVIKEVPVEVVKEVEVVRTPNLEELQRLLAQAGTVEVSRRVARDSGKEAGSLGDPSPSDPKPL